MGYLLAIAGIFNLQEISATDRIKLAEAIGDVVLGVRTPNVIQGTKLTPAHGH